MHAPGIHATGIRPLLVAICQGRPRQPLSGNLCHSCCCLTSDLTPGIPPECEQMIQEFQLGDGEEELLLDVDIEKVRGPHHELMDRVATAMLMQLNLWVK